MNRFLFAAGTALLLVLVAACETQTTPRFEADVSRFGGFWTADPRGDFFILASDEQKKSLEYEAYARAVARRLESWGYREVTDMESADYVVVFDYSIGGGRTAIDSTPIVGATGGGTTFHSGTFSTFGGGGVYSGYSYKPPTWDVVGTKVSSYTMYDRFFGIRIYDQKRSTKDNPVSVYEGTVTSSGTSGTFAAVSRCVIDALFDEFYKTGSTKVAHPTTACDIQSEPDIRAVNAWYRDNIPQESVPGVNGALIGYYTGNYKWADAERYYRIDLTIHDLETRRGNVEIYGGRTLWLWPKGATSVGVNVEFNTVTNELRITEFDPVDLQGKPDSDFIISGGYDGRVLENMTKIDAVWTAPRNSRKGYLVLTRQ